MGNLTTALVFVLTLNALIFLSQEAIRDVNPGALTFFHNDDHLTEHYDKSENGEYVLDTENTFNNLPSGSASVSPTTGNIFTDAFSSLKNWFAESTGLRYLGQVVGGPYNMLGMTNLPRSFVFAIGSLWYGITIFLIVAFLFGRSV